VLARQRSPYDQGSTRTASFPHSLQHTTQCTVPLAYYLGLSISCNLLVQLIACANRGRTVSQPFNDGLKVLPWLKLTLPALSYDNRNLVVENGTPLCERIPRIRLYILLLPVYPPAAVATFQRLPWHLWWPAAHSHRWFSTEVACQPPCACGQKVASDTQVLEVREMLSMINIWSYASRCSMSYSKYTLN
jgi:hypothetical protein